MLDQGVRSPIGAVEGAAPLGYDSGELPVVAGDVAAGWELAAAGGRAVAIVRLRGYDGQRRAAAWKGRNDRNSVYGHYLLPLLTVERLEAVHELACLVHIGADVDARALAARVTEAIWLPDGSFRLTWSDGARVEVPPLA